MKATIVFESNWNAINARNPDGSNKYRYIINEGSSRSSKTVSLTQCFDLYARSQTSKRCTIWRNVKTDCKKTVLVDMLKMLKREGLYKVNQDFNKTESIFTYGTESTVEIHGTDDEETVHGLTQDLAWLNEPYKIGRATFDQIDQRTSEFVFIDYNPKKGHWVEDLKKDERALIIHSTFRDNPFCPPEQRAKILSYQPVEMTDVVLKKLINASYCYNYDFKENNLSFTDKQMRELRRCLGNEEKNSASKFNWEVYGLGLKSEKPNRIFSGWVKISKQKFDAIDVPKYYGVDWGKVDPFGIVEVKYYDNALYVNELNYDSENEIKGKMSNTELAKIRDDEEGLITWMFNKLGIDKDSYVLCDNNRPGKIRALREAGWEYALGAAKGKGSIMDGVDALTTVQVNYTTTSKNLEYEYENYQYKTDREGVLVDEPEDRDNHICDPLRYVALFLKKEQIIQNI